jgi:hypothetical protein
MSATQIVFQIWLELTYAFLDDEREIRRRPRSCTLRSRVSSSALVLLPLRLEFGRADFSLRPERQEPETMKKQLFALSLLLLSVTARQASPENMKTEECRITLPEITFTRSLNGAADHAKVSGGKVMLASHAKRDNFRDPDANLAARLDDGNWLRTSALAFKFHRSFCVDARFLQQFHCFGHASYLNFWRLHPFSRLRSGLFTVSAGCHAWADNGPSSIRPCSPT